MTREPANVVNQQKKTIFMIYLTCIAFIGIVSESVILNQFAYVFMPNRLLIPTWLMAIWIAFPCMCATSLKHPLNHPLLAIGLGAIFGPLAYQGAASIGSIELINGIYGRGLLSLVWAIIMFIVHRWLKILRDH